MIKLFHWDRLKALPAPIQATIWFNTAATGMISIEGVVAMILKVDMIPMWILPLIAIAQQLVFLGADHISKLDLSKIWRLVFWMQVICGLTWALVVSFDLKWLIWFIMFCWMVDSVFWCAESNKLQDLISKRYPDEYLEYKRINTHNKILPSIIVSGVTSLAMMVSIEATMSLIVIGYIIQQFMLKRYITLWENDEPVSSLTPVTT